MRAARALCLAAVSALALAGCGGDDPRNAVSETFTKLADLRSGVLDLEVGVTPEGLDDGGPVGFRLSGPFRFRGGGEVPDMKLRYEQLGGEVPAEGTISVAGGSGSIEAGGTTRPLSAAQLDGLRGATGGGEEEGGLAGLGLDLPSWIEEPESDGGGKGTERISGRLDVRAALDDLLSAAGGEGAPEISETARKRLAEATRSSRVELVTGADDRLLRRLDARASFDLPEDLRALAGGTERLSVSFRLRIERPNEPVGL